MSRNAAGVVPSASSTRISAVVEPPSHPRLVPVDRVALDCAVDFVRDPALRPGALRPLFGILDLPVLPPEVIAREHAGPVETDALEHRRENVERFVGLDEAQVSAGLERVGERGVLAREVDLATEGGQAVPEATVDRLLRGTSAASGSPRSCASSSCARINERRT